MPVDLSASGQAVSVSDVRHAFGATIALENVALELPVGSDTAIIGPDGVGKSTLLSLIAGVRIIQSGRVEVLGGNMADRGHRNAVASRIAFMPQGLGRNLYPTLSVIENVAFFASLYATPTEDRQERIGRLLVATGLDPFPDRPAGKLSGGMRQKLSLCCALVHDPDILILDEPTTGIDPLSRRQFWQLIDGLRQDRPNLTLLVSTAYMDEAERFSRIAAMDKGRILAAGTRPEVLAKAGASHIEAAYVALRGGAPAKGWAGNERQRLAPNGSPAMVAKDLTCRFGDFTAVDNVSFEIARGEIFGFLGSNGCGKTTTMKMLTGLTPATSGSAELLGKPIDATDLTTRRRIGYMSQSFSLYRELTVRGNLELHAKLYDVRRSERRTRIEEALVRFGLSDVSGAFPDELPLGVRQRLQLAAACLHKPEVLILDEPTSGVDPEARDEFWRFLVTLSRDEQVTIFISTHFMNEAERCDRISLMHAGKVLALGTPASISAAEKTATLEDAFIKVLERSVGSEAAVTNRIPVRPTGHQQISAARAWLAWVLAFAMREGRELARDRIRLSFAFLAPLLLLVTFARGISFDIEALPFAVFDRDRSAASQSLIVHLAGSRYFAERPQILADVDVDRRLQSGDVAVVVEIPPEFGRELLRGHKPTLSLWLDGADPSRAHTARGYVEGISGSFVASLAEPGRSAATMPGVSFEPRFLYNQDFRSVYAIAPGVVMFLTMMVFAMMTALGVVREKEIGSIINLSVSPATTGSFLIGKMIPYVAIGFLALLLMITLTVLGLEVPIKGSLVALLVGGFIYVMASAAFGTFVSAFIRTQIAAILACAILSVMVAISFSGFMQPLSNMSQTAQLIGMAFPPSWFQQISIGTFTKARPFADFAPVLGVLAVFPAVYLLAAWMFLSKQER
jgi:ribosome-dependent ATPase